MLGVLLYCFNTEYYRYDKIAAKTVPLLKKNLGLPITIVTNFDTFKCMPPLGFINYKIVDNEKGNNIDNKPWHNLDRHRAYELSPYDKTILLDIDYFCYTDHLLTLTKTDQDFMVHDKVHDVSGNDSYKFPRSSMVPMVWATCIIFKKTERTKAIFDMVRYIKERYTYFCELYRINFRNFRNDYAFAIALHQLGGFKGYETIPTRLPTLPGGAKVTKVTDTGVSWIWHGRVGSVENCDVHVIDKGVQNV
tara:strand:- start:472 stop:1218 length:747 start_codon:yes stop_codon:yes gene_type:complete